MRKRRPGKKKPLTLSPHHGACKRVYLQSIPVHRFLFLSWSTSSACTVCPVCIKSGQFSCRLLLSFSLCETAVSRRKRSFPSPFDLAIYLNPSLPLSLPCHQVQVQSTRSRCDGHSILCVTSFPHGPRFASVLGSGDFWEKTCETDSNSVCECDPC